MASKVGNNGADPRQSPVTCLFLFLDENYEKTRVVWSERKRVPLDNRS